MFRIFNSSGGHCLIKSRDGEDGEHEIEWASEIYTFLSDGQQRILIYEPINNPREAILIHSLVHGSGPPGWICSSISSSVGLSAAAASDDNIKTTDR